MSSVGFGVFWQLLASSSLVVASSMGLLRSLLSNNVGWGGGGGIRVGVGLQGRPGEAVNGCGGAGWGGGGLGGKIPNGDEAAAAAANNPG